MSFDPAGQLRPDDPAAAVVLDQGDWFLQDEDEIEEPAAELRLGEIAVPALIVLGDRDIEPIADIGRRYQQGIRGARLVTLAPADHLLPLRVPDQLHPILIITQVDCAARTGPSDRDQPDGRVKKMEIAGIGGDNLLPRAARADHHMGIDNVRRSARGEQPADIGGVHPAEVDHVGCRLPDEARQPGLSLRPSDRLGQCGRRDGDAGAGLTCAGQEDTTRRSFRSRAIRPAASRVTPGIRRPTRVA